ncbi:hypothetical protein AC1031_009295 [Aphanomyces cochlioides]|nr:hypothetical protein AC1031_009295 [Aphanomyces cochlioides]
MFSNQIMPVANVICARREIKQQVDMLYENIKSPKGLCHISPPRTFAHLQFNAKKHTQMKARKATIDHDNHLLMEKMAHIMLSKPAKASSFKPGTCLDSNQLPKIDNHNDYTLVHGYQKTRLNEAKRIAKENALHRKRIKAQKPTYTNAQYAADTAERHVHLARMHRKLVWSIPTSRELKEEETRAATRIHRQQALAKVYDSPTRTLPNENIEYVAPVARNRMCICIDGFDPTPPLARPAQGCIFPRPPLPQTKPNNVSSPPRPQPPPPRPKDDEISVILQENEEMLDSSSLISPRDSLQSKPPSAEEEYSGDLFDE